MITFYIDEITQCLADTQTGEEHETEVRRIKSKKYLSQFHSRNGWYVNWSKFSKDTEIYGLFLKGDTTVQGLIALQYDIGARAVYIAWGCTAPHNNIWEYGSQKYKGVGGHLMAIAAELSINHGFDGYIHASAMDEELLNYYCKEFGAAHIGILHKYHFQIPGEIAVKFKEGYSYEWNNSEL